MAIAVFNCTPIITRFLSNTGKISVRNGSFRNVKESFNSYFRSGIPKPPYDHICQVGDPVLRTKATPIELKQIESQEFQNALDHLFNVLRKHNAAGLSAPQIGLPWQVFAIEMTDKSVNAVHPDIQKYCEMEIIPLTYFINPKLEIRDATQVTFSEICGSITGYQAEVPRAREVEVTALNRLGQKFSWKAKGWAARIAQHEFDHLQGTLFIDRMNPSTFECLCWNEVNRHNGKLQLSFRPKH